MSKKKGGGFGKGEHQEEDQEFSSEIQEILSLDLSLFMLEMKEAGLTNRQLYRALKNHPMMTASLQEKPTIEELHQKNRSEIIELFIG